MQSEMMKRASELLADGTVVRVLGWKNGEFVYDPTPAVFDSAEALEKDFVYHDFCGSNLSKYLIKLSKLEGKTLVFLKPCDSYSFNQLLTEHRIKRENVYIIGVPCDGKLDPDKVREAGAEGILGITTDGDTVKAETMYGEVSVSKKDCLLERCEVCKSHKVVVYDEMLGENGEENPESGRFDMVAKLEAMTPEERFAFWRGELSRCIRCNACRNICPACSCEQCVFDNPASGVSQKAAADSFEENMFHIIRAFHVAGRCTDCGECSRVCPQHIPLHLLNRMVSSFWWKMPAARPASMPLWPNSSKKSSFLPAPPLAMMGTLTRLATASSISRSKPFRTPSVSMLLRQTSPAPWSTAQAIQSSASRPVSSRPPLAKTRNWPSTRLTSAERTTHWLPYRWAAAGMRLGFLRAPELTLTLSAPHLSTRSKSSSVLMPPPTVRGMKISLATFVRISVKRARPSKLAVMS